MSFADYEIDPKIIAVLNQMAFTNPSLIQEKSIPHVLSGKDLICQAEAGTGKTLCFLIGVLQSALLIHQEEFKKHQQMTGNIQNIPILPFAIIIVPTRELSIQIMDIVTKIISRLLLNHEEDTVYNNLLKEWLQPHLFIGGLPVEQDRNILQTKRCSIIIGTVGRIIQLLSEKLMNLSKIRLLILDEADKLHENKIFQPHFQKILTNIVGRNNDSNKPQILCFSATYPNKIMTLIQKHLIDPLFIKANLEIQLGNLSQYFYKIEKHETKSQYQIKTEIIIFIMQQLYLKQTIIFYNDKMRGENLYTDLKAEGYSPVFIHGDLTQSDRIKVMNQLRRNTANLIISTDLLSRGIDVDTLDLVIHFDNPSNYDTYLHRIGRTGRFGTYGLSIMLNDGFGYQDIVEWNQDNLNDINQKLQLKHQGKVVKQNEEKEYYGNFLNRVSDWKNIEYKFYDNSKFQYFQEPEVIKDENNQQQQQQQISQQPSSSNQLFEPSIQKLVKIENDKILSPIKEIDIDQELQEILDCKCCKQFYAQLTMFSKELEQYFK